jgi:hypothetical protein
MVRTIISDIAEIAALGSFATAVLVFSKLAGA